MSSPAATRGNKSKKAYTNCPPIQLIVRDLKGWRLYKQHHKTGKLSIQSATKPCTDADIIFSLNGEFFAVLLETGIEIYESFAGRLIASLDQFRVRNVYFSPLNNFLVSYHHRRQADKHGNCWVWQWDRSASQNDDESKDDTKTPFKVIYQFYLPEFDKKRVPLQFTNDEVIAARISRDAVLVHDVRRLHFKSNNIIGKLDMAKVASVVVAPCRRPSGNKNDPNRSKGNNSYLLAVFAMPKNNKAATVTIFEYQYSLAMNKKSNTTKLFSKISQRAFYNVDQCELFWDPSDKSYHHNLLAIASSDVDTSGKSYYGNQTLFLLSSRNNSTVKIPISEKGKLQDVKWSPFGRQFVLIDDHPQKISVFDSRGNTICSLGQYARNLIRFSKDGRFLWCGGFGNLTGEMTFYDYKQVTNRSNGGDKGQCLGYNTDDACRYFEWSPDSSTFLTARLYPYMTVDNGFRIYKYNGHRLYEQTFDRLYQIAYRPSLKHVYPQRSPSPNSQRKAKSVPKASAKKRYVPPHLRPKKKKGDKTAAPESNDKKAPKQPKAAVTRPAAAQQPAVQNKQRANYQPNRQNYQNHQNPAQQNYQANYQQNQQQSYQHQNYQNHQNQQYGQRQNYYNQQNQNQGQKQNQGQTPNNTNYQQPKAKAKAPQQPQSEQILQDAQNQFNQMEINNNNEKKDQKKENAEGGDGDGGANKKKKRRKRNKNKNKQNQDNSANVQGAASNSGSGGGGRFKPGLADNDNRRWARGSKIDTNQ